jgi:transposase-like protein
METVEKVHIPDTLIEAITYYADEANCFKAMCAMRWPDGVITCPRCESMKVTLFATRPLFKCNRCKRQFTVKVGTVFEDSPLPLSKWLPAVWLLAGAKNGISSCELARALGVCQKTAWFMLHRIRHAMNTGTFVKLKGTVEADETAIGGIEKNKHKDKRGNVGGGSVGKAIVQAFLERGDNVKSSTVRAALLSDPGGPTMKQGVRDNVEAGSNLFTDGASQYRGLNKNDEYLHDWVDHAVLYVKGQVHTNGLENYFSLLKRCIKGTYVSVEPFHLLRYCDEETFRFNERKDDDAGRFVKVLKMVSGKRLTYRELTSSYEDYYQQVGL